MKQLQLKTISTTLEDIKEKLRLSYTENPLKFWDKNQDYAEIKLKDENKIIRVKPMRYNPTDQDEFKK